MLSNNLTAIILKLLPIFIIVFVGFGNAFIKALFIVWFIEDITQVVDNVLYVVPASVAVEKLEMLKRVCIVAKSPEAIFGVLSVVLGVILLHDVFPKLSDFAITNW